MAQRKTPAKKGSSRSASSRRKSPSRSRSKEMTLFDLLQQDHRKVIDLFDQLEEDGEMEMDSRGDLFAQIEEELDIHMQGEERFFYPALEQSEEGRDKVLEGYEEHHVAKTVLEEFGGMPQDDERWMAKVKVLKEIVAHHVKEEEGGIFKMARKALDKEQIQEIAQQIQQAKGQSAEA
ncbi:MAG TPA: hemerythrin domain-containing protein [Thermodesulfobacteriota bacterium]|nr:hemerythrin domain-containing protein [Thermodesulfobacteriota bacterium]